MRKERKERKDEHIEKFLKAEFVGDTLLSCVWLEHNALPELSITDIDTRVKLFGKTMSFPLYINAITGGTDMTEGINEDLATLANELGLGMQVGSQRVALEDKNAEGSFLVVRDVLSKELPLMANLGATASVEEIKKAMDMIDADGIGLHLNVAQELAMSEGDRDFKGVVSSIEKAVENYGEKILVKEVGFGMSASVISTILDKGVRNIDISGYGGTNFLEIEDLRACIEDRSDIYRWGIPTAATIVNATEISYLKGIRNEVKIIASGGIKSANDLVRALVLGADTCAISGELLRYLIMGGYDYAKKYLIDIIEKTKLLMVLLGARNIEELHKVPHRLTGRLAEITSPPRCCSYKSRNYPSDIEIKCPTCSKE